MLKKLTVPQARDEQREVAERTANLCNAFCRKICHHDDHYVVDLSIEYANPPVGLLDCL